MPISVVELQKGFVSRVSGLDLRQPISKADTEAVRAAIDRLGVLVIPGQTIDDEQQMAFSAALGPLEGQAGGSIRKPGDYRLAPSQTSAATRPDGNREGAKAT